MGKGSKPTVGFWYRVAYHHGLTIGPIDAFLEFRGGDKTAWRGELTASDSININAPMLWGGEKDQGGIVGKLAVMFGEPTQAPNDYLVSAFGNQTAAWRGFATVAFEGGRFGAMNPYPQKPSYKIRQILEGWDQPGCWYPEKAQVNLPGADQVTVTLDDFHQVATTATTTPAPGKEYVVPPSAVLSLSVPSLGETNAFSFFAYDTQPPSGGLTWCCAFSVQDDQGVIRNYLPTLYATAAEAVEAAIASGPILLSGSTSYTVFLKDDNAINNRGELTLSVAATWGGIGAINPAHVLYYSRTNSDMGRESRSAINDASLRAAADKLYDEGFGICPKWDPASESVDEFEKRICKLIGGSFTRSLEDGQWYLDLARGDYVLADLPVLTDDDILDFKEQPAILDNAVNSVSVRYFDPQKKETIVTAPARALGLVAAFGPIHQTTDYIPIPTAGLATRIAERDVMASATPKRVFDLANTHKTYAWRPNQYFRLQSPKRGIADMVCLVGDKQSGTLKSGAIKMKAVQDIYRQPSTSYVQVEPGVDTRPPQTPTAITQQRALEAPYVEIAAMLSRADLAALPAEVGYAMAVAADPGGDLDYTMMVADAGGDYSDAGRGEWCATAKVVEAANYPDTNFTLADGAGLDAVTVGMGVLWDDEIARVDTIDVAAGTITLGRGCVDTTPPPTHAAGSRLWIYPTGFAYSLTEFTDAETVDVKLLANTGSQQQELADATALPIVFDQRQARPYPPAGLQINGETYPSSVTGPELEIAFVPRDRVLQADQFVDTLMPGVGPEAGTTYTLRGYLDGTLSHTESDATVSPFLWTPGIAGAVRVEIDAVRDGLESWQPLTAEFDFTTGGDLAITGVFPDAVVGVAYDEFATISGGELPYTLTGGTGVASGTLPAGMSLSIENDDELHLWGTPTTAETADFTDSVGSADGQTATSVQSVTVGAAVQTVLSATNKALHISLDASKTRATSTDGTGLGGLVLSESGKAAGNYYFEVFCNNAGGGISQAVGAGIQKGIPALTNYAGQSDGGASWAIGTGGMSRATIINGTTANTTVVGSQATNQTMRCAISITPTAVKVWLSKFGNPAWVGGGDPELGTSPTFTLTTGGTYYIALSPRADQNSLSLTSVSLWAYTAPTGFDVWT